MSKEKTIYKADIRRYNITNLEIFDGIKKFSVEKPIVKKDALFYINGFGVTISLDYDSKLPDLQEAKELSEAQAEANLDHRAVPGYLYYDEETFKIDKIVSKNEFKELKKTYKKR